MVTTTLYYAKAHLSALVEEVSQSGQELIITRHGKPIARLAPLSAPAWKPVWDAPDRLRPTLHESPTAAVYPAGFPLSEQDPI
ncbi:MAG: type II toxin-antitoxin system Phd/YefM family antitoxin [Fibrobacteres bacterium]|nr:type II toxin-antitoxin system Phd/YefM family antitoxin [Fibrobacterota bacterium]